MEYPIFKKQNRCITAILSSSAFLQIEMINGVSYIRAGKSANIISEAMMHSDVNDCALCCGKRRLQP